MYQVYMLRCKGNSIYTGITTDFSRRFRQHCGAESGGAKYTRSHPPEEVLCVWETETRSNAQKLEYCLKHLTHKQKEDLIAIPFRLATLFPELGDNFRLKCIHALL
ncbi:MAG: GIY-YIG nuclease family protein [Ruminococcus sp.]|nr:GIY-YIG nuclease family protein [Ruminococcus sp.]